MRRNSIIMRLFVVLSAFVIILSIGASTLINFRIEDDISIHLKDEVDIVTEALNFAVTPLLESDDGEAIQNLVDTFSKYDIVKGIRIHDPSGLVLFSNDPSEIGTLKPSSLISQAVENPKGGRQTLQLNEDILMTAVPLICGHEGHVTHSDNPQGRADAILCIAMNFRYTTSIANTIASDLRLAFVVITVLFLLSLYIGMKRFIGMPLNELVKAADEISKNNYSHRIEIKSTGELMDLSHSFNAMAENIENYAVNLDSAKKAAEKASEVRLEFLAKMSHEIRTPLNAIIGFSDILAEEIEHPEQKESIDIVVSSGKHLLGLVNEVLDIAKLENEQMEIESQPFSIREVIGDLRKMFHLVTEDKGIELSYEIDVDVPLMLVGDAYRIRQVLINLVSNAVKFTESGYIEILASMHGPELNIIINDTGIGIPEDKQDDIFDAYIQSDTSVASVYGGTGLGLAITKKLVMMMGGVIGLESKVGKGTTFKIQIQLEQLLLEAETGSQMVERWIYADSTVEDIVLEVLESLPQRLEEIRKYSTLNDWEQLEFHVHSLKGVSGNFNITNIYELAKDFEQYLMRPKVEYGVVQDYLVKLENIMKRIPSTMVETRTVIDEDQVLGELKILLAEDVSENQLLIKQILRNESVQIDCANNGVEAIELLERNRYDCLLLDIQMPILTGEDVLKWLRTSEKVEGMYVIALTANAFKEDMEKYMTLGAHWFLSKPVKKDVLRSKVRDLIQLKRE